MSILFKFVEMIFSLCGFNVHDYLDVHHVLYLYIFSIFYVCFGFQSILIIFRSEFAPAVNIVVYSRF